MSKRIKILFTLSLVLNFLLIGAAAGVIAKRFKEPWPEKLSDHGQSVVRSVIRERIKEFLPLRVEVFKKKRQMYKLLAEDDFDPLAYDVLAQEISSLKSQFEQKKAEAMKDVIVGLSDEERKEFSREMAEKISGREQRWRQRGFGERGKKAE